MNMNMECEYKMVYEYEIYMHFHLVLNNEQSEMKKWNGGQTPNPLTVLHLITHS